MIAQGVFGMLGTLFTIAFNIMVIVWSMTSGLDGPSALRGLLE